MIEFEHHEKARSFLGIACALFSFSFGVFAIATGDPVGIVFGVLFLPLSLFAARSIYKEEVWSMRIEEGILTWNYPHSRTSWSPTTGTLMLDDVMKAVINEDLSLPELSATMRTGETRRVQLMNSGYALREHLVAHYPEISLEYIPPRASS